MKVVKKKLRTNKGFREYTYLGCPLTHNRSAWCFRMCTPDGDGHGQCGRIAPHGLTGKTQMAIKTHTRKRFEAHAERLERLYLASPYNEYHEPGIRISEGEADILITIREELAHDEAPVPGPICFKAMNDAAVFAVNSLVDDARVFTVNFSISLTRMAATGDLMARGRFVGMSGDHYLAQAILTDGQGKEIGRGEGAFVRSEIPLSPDGTRGSRASATGAVHHAE